jgi:hypothetical protein
MPLDHRQAEAAQRHNAARLRRALVNGNAIDIARARIRLAYADRELASYVGGVQDADTALRLARHDLRRLCLGSGVK